MLVARVHQVMVLPVVTTAEGLLVLVMVMKVLVEALLTSEQVLHLLIALLLLVAVVEPVVGSVAPVAQQAVLLQPLAVMAKG
jgi:hypothetical protein